MSSAAEPDRAMAARAAATPMSGADRSATVTPVLCARRTFSASTRPSATASSAGITGESRIVQERTQASSRRTLILPGRFRTLLRWAACPGSSVARRLPRCRCSGRESATALYGRSGSGGCGKRELGR